MDRIGFSVVANHDVHITLSSDDSFPSNSWEIVLGGWSGTRSAIRKTHQSDAVVAVGHTSAQFKKVRTKFPLTPGSRGGKYLPLASIFIVIFQLILYSRQQNTPENLQSARVKVLNLR